MISYMTEEQARAAILDVGRRVYDRGLVGANDGNISVRLSEDTILVTPTGVSKGFMTAESLVKMRLDGTVLGQGKPSSETKMHLRAYTDRPEIGGIVHVHPPIATACSVIGLPLTRPVVAEGVLVTGNIPIAPYAKPGSEGVPEAIAPFLKDYNGCLLERHGALTWGSDVYQALFRMEAMEHQAKILLYSLLLGKLTGRSIKGFSEEECKDLMEIRAAMGILTGGVPESGREADW